MIFRNLSVMPDSPFRHARPDRASESELPILVGILNGLEKCGRVAAAEAGKAVVIPLTSLEKSFL